MHADELLARLEGVRRSGGGWMARCSAHDDRHPSLSIRAGDRGLLLRCFAGCSLEDITAALGLAVKDLFYAQHANPAAIRESQRRRAAERRRREAIEHVGGLTADVLREAEQFISSRRGLDISTWTAERLDDELNAVADAYSILAREALDG